MPHLVRYSSTHAFVSAVTEPDLEQAFLGAERQTQPDYLRLFKLLAYDSQSIKSEELLTDKCQQQALPHLINVVVLLHFRDPDTTEWRLLPKVSSIKVFTYFPHGHFLIAEEE